MSDQATAPAPNVLIIQPVPRPATVDEYERIKHQLIDTHGNPLVTKDCPACRHSHFTVEPCATEVPCENCGSTRARCLRPSEHESGSGWHKVRRDAFEALCAAREAAGLPQVARWPDARPATHVEQDTLW